MASGTMVSILRTRAAIALLGVALLLDVVCVCSRTDPGGWHRSVVGEWILAVVPSARRTHCVFNSAHMYFVETEEGELEGVCFAWFGDAEFDALAPRVVGSVYAVSRTTRSGFWAPTESRFSARIDLGFDLVADSPSETVAAGLMEGFLADDPFGLYLSAQPALSGETPVSLVRNGNVERATALPLGYVHNAGTLMLLGGFVFSVRARRAWVREQRRLARFHCPACTYDIRGLTRGMCPECGRGLGSAE